MNYEESKLLSLLNKQDIDMLFLKANSYLCQTKSLFEEKEQLQQENEQQKEAIDMFLNKVDKNKMLLNNPDLLDLYLKIKEVSE